MKYAIVLAVCLAMFASSEAFGGFPGGGDSHGFQPSGDLLSDLRFCLAQKIANNATLLSNLITALNSASLSSYVITVNGSQTVNFTALFQNAFTTLPALSSYFYTYILPSYTKLTPSFNATLTVISQLSSNQTVIMEFIGNLYIQDLFSYISGSQGSYVVDYVSIQANEQYSRVLYQFISSKVAGSIFSNIGFFGKRR